MRAETRRILLALVATAFLPSAPLRAQGGPEPASQPPPPETQKSGVRVRNADIHGQVFLASEREGQDETPGPDVIVQIRDPKDGTILQKGRTDKDGKYTFAQLDVGLYELRIGALKLKITVVPETEAGTELPKVIIVIIPRIMANYKPE